MHFASTADRATETEQIAIAQKVLKDRPGAWPVCSVRAGLTRSNGAAAKPTAAAKPAVVRATAKTPVKAPAKAPAKVLRRPLRKAVTGHTVEHIVRHGETLSGIARQLDIPAAGSPSTPPTARSSAPTPT